MSKLLDDLRGEQMHYTVLGEPSEKSERVRVIADHTEELEQQLKQRDERLEKAEEVIGFYAGEDVACVIYELDDSSSPYVYESSKEGNSIMGTKARKYQQKYMSEDSDE